MSYTGRGGGRRKSAPPAVIVLLRRRAPPPPPYPPPPSRWGRRRGIDVSPTSPVEVVVVVVRRRRRARVDDDDDGRDVVDAYALLARSIRYRLDAYDSALPAGKHGIASASSALRSLSATQSALKRIDGAAHEVYQRTHRSSTSLDDGGGDEGVDDDDDDDDGSGDEDGGGGGVRVKGGVGGLKVAGRMSRNAARVGCVADALFAAELCELAGAHRRRRGCDDGDDDEDGTLAPRTGREVLLNVTIRSPDDRLDLAVSVLVMRERDYDGGAGTGHGGVDDLLSSARGGEEPPPPRATTTKARLRGPREGESSSC